MFYDYMIYIVFDFMMAVIMFLFGMWFYKSEGKAANFLSGYNMKSADERKKYDENAMCKAYGKRMMFMSVPFIIGIIIDIQYQGIGCWIAYQVIIHWKESKSSAVPRFFLIKPVSVRHSIQLPNCGHNPFCLSCSILWS